MRRLFLILAALTAVPAGALADGVTAPYNMQSLDGDSRAGADMMLGRFELDFLGGEVDATTFNLDVFAQAEVSPNVIVFGRLPIQYGRLSVDDESESGSGLGNITGGAMFVSRSGATSFGGGGSISLPTAPDDGEGALGASANAQVHIVDFGLYLPDTTTIRLHGDLRIEQGKAFFQGRGGVDYLSFDDGETDDTLKLLRIGLAGGTLISPTTALLAELTTLSDILEDDDGFGDEEEWIHILELGVRTRSGNTLFGARIYLPLDEEFRDANTMGLGVDVSGTF